MWIGWQSKRGVLRTAFESDSFAAAAELFERVRFDDTPDGLVIESPIDESSRPVAMLAYAPSLGLIDSSPRDSISNAGRVPTNEGTATAGGAKMYWTSTRQRSVLLVHETAITTVQPTANQDLAGVADLEISWTRDPSTSG